MPFVAATLVALFAATLVDYWVLRSIGIRLFPVSYAVIRAGFYGLGAVTLLLAVLGFRTRAGVFRLEVAWHRVVILLCLPPMLGTILGFVGGLWWLADLFAHFRVQYAVMLAVGGLALLALKAWKLSAWVLVLALANGVIVSPQLVPSAASPAIRDRSRMIRFVLANVNVSNEDPEPLLRFLKEVDADVIALQEVNDRWVRDLAPLDESYPHAITSPRASPFGLGLWSRIPMEHGEVVGFVSEHYPSIVATLNVRGERVVVVTSHPNRPQDPDSAARRDRQLDAMAEVARAAQTHVVVIGDLNTTPWGHAFRRFASRSGLVDSSRWAGPQPTWPVGSWLFAMPIDHAFHSESLELVDRRLGPSVGSDHYPLVLDVAF